MREQGLQLLVREPGHDPGFDTALFTIITITKDNAAGLQKTWKSLMSQTCTDYEWIVIDGNSSDGTKSLLKSTDAKWVSEPDNGIYDAMNKGIDKAKGDWLLFLSLRS